MKGEHHILFKLISQLFALSYRGCFLSLRPWCVCILTEGIFGTLHGRCFGLLELFTEGALELFAEDLPCFVLLGQDPFPVEQDGADEGTTVEMSEGISGVRDGVQMRVVP